jgi:hypothetical protein|tara:strand:+ start:400 stop:708 length:309 start_codon:yes stop_codon:yes gene_type:complete
MTIEDILENENVDRLELQKQLHREILEVTFTKVNGDKRIMNCTLIEGIAPAITTVIKEDAPERKVNLDTMSAWDIDARGWRSFRVKNVTRIRQHGLAGYNHA